MKPKNLIATLAATQSKMVAAQKEISSKSFTGTAQGGLASVTLNGTGEMTELKLDPSLAEEDMDTVAALVMAACKNAYQSKEAFAKEKLKALGGPLGSLGLGALVG